MSGVDHGSSSPASPAPSTPAATTASGTAAAGPHNDADVMFAQMMIPHHQQAIQMSDMILTKDGIKSEITDLAQQIKGAQAPEIAQMRGWLAGWGQNPSPSLGMDHDMDGGTMTQAEMDVLETATGDQAGRLFLTGMIKHHQGAITMAEAELADGQKPRGQTTRPRQRPPEGKTEQHDAGKSIFFRRDERGGDKRHGRNDADGHRCGDD